MLKRDKNFRLTKSVKRVMATMADQNKMHQYKNLMITASVLGSIQVKNKKDKNEKEAD